MYLVVFLCINLIASLFSSSAKDDVDDYIRQLRHVFPAVPADCFVNVCDEVKRKGTDVMIIPHAKYFFINEQYIAECSKAALEQALSMQNSMVVWGNLAASLNHWMTSRLDKFQKCLKDDTGAIRENRAFAASCENEPCVAFMALYKRDSFLSTCVQDAVKAKKDAQNQRSSSVLRGGRSKMEKGDQILGMPSTAVSKETSRETVAALLDVKPHLSKVASMESAAENLAIMDIKRNSSAGLSYAKKSPSASVDYTEIARGLSSAQLVALDVRYAGSGLATFAEKYEQALKDGFFAELARSSTPNRRFVSRSPVKGRAVSQSPKKQYVISEPDLSELRTFSPARERPFTISYMNKGTKKKYKDFFAKSENSAANTHFQDFLSVVSARGLSDYIGRSEPFRSISGAYKFAVGERARILFKRGEGDTLILVGDPDHYGDS